MATVNVDVNGRSYAVGCVDGQEDHVRTLASAFDGQVREIADQVGHIGDSRLFLLAALMLSDQLQEARSQLSKRPSGPVPTASVAKAPVQNNEGVAEALNAVAARIEKIAQNL